MSTQDDDEKLCTDLRECARILRERLNALYVIPEQAADRIAALKADLAQAQAVIKDLGMCDVFDGDERCPKSAQDAYCIEHDPATELAAAQAVIESVRRYADRVATIGDCEAHYRRGWETFIAECLHCELLALLPAEAAKPDPHPERHHKSAEATPWPEYDPLDEAAKPEEATT